MAEQLNLIDYAKQTKLFELFGELINDTIKVTPRPGHVWLLNGGKYDRVEIAYGSDGPFSVNHAGSQEYRIADVAETHEGERIVLLADPTHDMDLMFYEVPIDQIFKPIPEEAA